MLGIHFLDLIQIHHLDRFPTFFGTLFLSINGLVDLLWIFLNEPCFLFSATVLRDIAKYDSLRHDVAKRRSIVQSTILDQVIVMPIVLDYEDIAPERSLVCLAPGVEGLVFVLRIDNGIPTDREPAGQRFPVAFFYES